MHCVLYLHHLHRTEVDLGITVSVFLFFKRIVRVNVEEDSYSPTQPGTVLTKNCLVPKSTIRKYIISRTYLSTVISEGVRAIRLFGRMSTYFTLIFCEFECSFVGGLNCFCVVRVQINFISICVYLNDIIISRQIFSNNSSTVGLNLFIQGLPLT